MGVDLTVCPVKWWPQISDWWPCYDRLAFHVDYELFEQIKDLGCGTGSQVVCTPKLVPKNVDVQWYGDDGLESIKTDPYGQKLTYVEADQFKKVSTVSERQWNWAILMFLKSLNHETPVLLYWS